MKLFHGCNVEVVSPRILANGCYKDFGFGFYCTNIEKQAKRWAMNKKKQHMVSIYKYHDNKSLKVKTFPEMTEEWLDFIVANRNGELHSFDIVEGPMVDDTIWDYMEDFWKGNITREAFWVLVKFKYPIHQIVFCTEQALESISFEGSYEL